MSQGTRYTGMKCPGVILHGGTSYTPVQPGREGSGVHLYIWCEGNIPMSAVAWEVDSDQESDPCFCA